MAFKDLKDIINFAIGKEQEAAAFYEDASNEEMRFGTKGMLKEFAQEERKHQKLLEKFISQGIVEGLDDYELKWIGDIKRSDYVDDLEYHKGMLYNDLLLLAMKREEKALALYNKMQENADSEAGRTLFKMLCQEEAKHKLQLEILYDDYMAEMGD